MLEVILFCSIGGVLGTGLGGLIGSFIGKGKRETIFKILSLAGGVMISIVCFELLPSSVSSSNLFNAVTGVFWGVVITYFINLFIVSMLKKNKLDKIGVLGTKNLEKYDANKAGYAEVCVVKGAQVVDKKLGGVAFGKGFADNKTEKKAYAENNLSMFKTGLIIMLALSLHNIPEGLAIGTATSLELGSGLTLAIIIAMHDLPEGIAVSLPLVASGMHKFKAFLYALVSGLFTVVGGIIGHLLGNISDFASSFCLALASGAMLFVVCCEILPQISVSKNKEKIFIYTLIGIVAGFVIVSAL